jgi:hypothetical protein
MGPRARSKLCFKLVVQFSFQCPPRRQGQQDTHHFKEIAAAATAAEEVEPEGDVSDSESLGSNDSWSDEEEM